MILSFNVNVPRLDKYPTYKRDETYNDLDLFRLSDARTCEIDLCGNLATTAATVYYKCIKRNPEFKGIKALTRCGHLYLVKIGEEA